MKRYLVAALIAATWSSAQAEHQVIFKGDDVEVTQVTDDLDNTITSCEMTIGHAHSGQGIAVNIFAEPKSDLDNLSVSVQSQDTLAVGYQFYIDQHWPYERGNPKYRDHVVFGHFDMQGLHELKYGSAIVIKDFPANNFDNPETAIYKLQDMETAILAFENCLR